MPWALVFAAADIGLVVKKRRRNEMMGNFFWLLIEWICYRVGEGRWSYILPEVS